MSKRIIGVYDTEQEAIRAIQDLKNQGFSADDISVVAKNHDNVSSVEDATGSKVEEGLATGAAAGGTVGGLTGLLAGLGALAIPGIGPIVAAGPIAAALTGAAAGAGVGGLGGALIGMGIPEDEANRYDADVNAGKILVMVDDDADRRHYDDTYTGTLTATGTADTTYGTVDNDVTGRPIDYDRGVTGTGRSLGVGAGSDTYGTMDGRPGMTEDGFRDSYAGDRVGRYDDSTSDRVRDNLHDAKETIKDKFHDLKEDVKDAVRDDGDEYGQHRREEQRNAPAYMNRRGGAYSDDTRSNFVDGDVPDVDGFDTTVGDIRTGKSGYDATSTDPMVAGANITSPAERGTEYTEEEQRRLRAGLRDKTGYGDYDPTR